MLNEFIKQLFDFSGMFGTINMAGIIAIIIVIAIIAFGFWIVSE